MIRTKIIAFTHKTTDLNEIGKLHIDEAQLQERLDHLKITSVVDELQYLSTCNRVEFMLSYNGNIDKKFLKLFFGAFDSKWKEADINWAINNAQVFEGEEALRHLFNVASSIDSLVVGEREIITQVRNAYEKCSNLNLTGDLIRLAIKRTIEVAKDVYTHTNIARNPVSVVSLAYRKLRALNVKQDARFLIIGSGVTNTTMAKYLKKHEFANFSVFNRTLENAQKLAEELKGKAYPLSELKNFKLGFDIIVTCTGAAESIITPEIYKSLVGDDRSKKIVIDLAIPNDLDAEILKNYDVNLIAINNLQEVAKENLLAREQEMQACNAIIERNIEEFKQIIKTRKVELAMSEVPKKMKAIRETANEVFAKELESLDVQSKETLDKILSYMEKKYISVPMKIAKEILIEDAKTK
ncbi:MAG: glutamyl-tRNA reductase [Bacteroidetes bacterium RIFCSPLOWO2_12_FULL_35_15]|nr:MAG: glutamyl-tRNA reductase [Bacteroidetes bacterium RIFCSPLOWO2_12_FULL_35_15]